RTAKPDAAASLRRPPTRSARQSVLHRPGGARPSRPRPLRFGGLLLAPLGNRFSGGPATHGQAGRRRFASAASYSLRSAIGSPSARRRTAEPDAADWRPCRPASPERTAQAATSVRLDMPSFIRMFETWTAAVLGE